MELYNMNDKEYKNYIRGLCLAKMPIPFYNRALHHIEVKDIFAMGEENYNKLIKPFRLNSDALLGKTISGEERYLLDVLLSDILGSSLQMDYCIEFLKIIFVTEDIKLADMPNDDTVGTHKEVVIDDMLWLDKYKFEQLSEIVLKMCSLVRITEKEVNEDKSEKRLTYEQIMNIKDTRERDYQLAIYNKNKKDEDEQSKKLSLYSIYNYICSCSGAIDYEKPLNFNIPQFYNSYKILNEIEKYKYDMKVLTSGMCSDTKKIDSRLLSERIVDK